MSILELRERAISDLGWRECLERRPTVLRRLAREFPGVGSAEIEDAVDGALVELVEKGIDAEGLLRLWSRAARNNVIDATRAPRLRWRVAPAVEDLAGVLAQEEREPPSEEVREHYRMAEALAHLTADERRWAAATLGATTGAHRPRDLCQALGWPDWRYRRVAASARRHLLAFFAARADGTLCRRRQAVLEAFAQTHLSRAGTHPSAVGGDALGEEEYRRVLLHVKGCVMCERQWRQHERALLDVRHILIPTPLLLTALVAAKAKFGMAVHSARVRIGGTGAGGGVAATLGGKGAAVICAGAICASAAGTALVSGVPAILTPPTHHAAAHRRLRHPTAPPAPTSAARAQTASYTVEAATSATATSATATPTPPATKGEIATRSTRQKVRRHPTDSSTGARARAARVTPGDLVVVDDTASVRSSHAPAAARAASVQLLSRASAPAAGTSVSHASKDAAPTGCTPGDLAC
jgi:hypothetical protein